MTNLTIRIDEDLKKQAFHQAEKMGISLTLVLKNALRDFVVRREIIISEPETIAVTPAIQQKMNKIGKLLSK